MFILSVVVVRLSDWWRHDLINDIHDSWVMFCFMCDDGFCFFETKRWWRIKKCFDTLVRLPSQQPTCDLKTTDGARRCNKLAAAQRIGPNAMRSRPDQRWEGEVGTEEMPAKPKAKLQTSKTKFEKLRPTFGLRFSEFGLTLAEVGLTLCFTVFWHQTIGLKFPEVGLRFPEFGLRCSEVALIFSVHFW